MTLDQGVAALIVGVLTLFLTVWNAVFNRSIVRQVQRAQQAFDKKLTLAQHELDRKLGEHIVGLEPLRVEHEMRTRDGLNREQARQAFIDDVVELQRHSLENWHVLQTVVRDIQLPRGTPYDHHIENMLYLQDFRSFQALNVEVLPEEWRSMSAKIRVMLRNANGEIKTAIRMCESRDAEHLARYIKDTLLPKAQCFFTIWTAAADLSFYTSLESNWLRNGLIEAARKDEISNGIKEQDLWKLNTLQPAHGPIVQKPIKFYSSES